MNERQIASKHPPERARTRPRWLLIGLGFALFLGAQRGGVFHRLQAPEAFARSIEAFGPLGMVVFVCGFAFLQPLGIPGSVFYLASALIWRFPTAFALSLLGSMAASAVGFSFARHALREFLTPRIPERLQRYNAALASRGFRTVFWLRFVLWTSPLLHAFLGLSRVRFWVHFYASFCAYLLPVLTLTFFGRRVFTTVGEWGRGVSAAFHAARIGHLTAWESRHVWGLAIAVLTALAGLASVVRARRTRAKSSKSTQEAAKS